MAKELIEEKGKDNDINTIQMRNLQTRKKKVREKESERGKTE